jgi:hypothetical protein
MQPRLPDSVILERYNLSKRETCFGIPTVWWKPKFDLIAPDVVMAIPYSSVRSDLLRCWRRSAFRSRSGVPAILALPLLDTGFCAYLFSGAGIGGQAAAFGGMLFVYLVLIVHWLFSAINSTYPTKSHIRTSTLALTPFGFIEITSGSIVFVPWCEVLGIESFGPDAFFYTKYTCKCFPCLMTTRRDDGQLLIETATRLWKGRPIDVDHLPVILPDPSEFRQQLTTHY